MKTHAFGSLRLFAMLVVALVLTACGTDSDTPTAAPTIATSPTAAPTTVPPTATSADGITVLPDLPTPTPTVVVNTPALAAKTATPTTGSISRIYAATVAGFYSINPDTLVFTQLLSISTASRPGRLLALSADKSTLFVLDENVDRLSETKKAAVGVRVFDAAAAKPLKTFRYAYTHDGRTYTNILLTPDGKTLYLLGLLPNGNTIVTLLNSADGTKTDEYTLAANPDVSDNAIYIYNALIDDANKHLVVAYSEGGTAISDLGAPHTVRIRLTSTLGAIIQSPSGYLLAARGGDGDPLGVYDPQNGGSLGVVATQAAGREIEVQYSPDGQHLYTLTDQCVTQQTVDQTVLPGVTQQDNRRGFRDINLLTRQVKGQDGEVCGSRMAVDPAGKRVFTAEAKTIAQVDLAYYSTGKTVTMPSRVWDILVVSK